AETPKAVQPAVPAAHAIDATVRNAPATTNRLSSRKRELSFMTEHLLCAALAAQPVSFSSTQGGSLAATCSRGVPVRLVWRITVRQTLAAYSRQAIFRPEMSAASHPAALPAPPPEGHGGPGAGKPHPLPSLRGA